MLGGLCVASKVSTAMDELLRDFLTETHESIDVVDVELVRFEQDPNNAKILDKVFRLVHTIKGTCGFLNLPRLEALTHAAEALMGKFRDGARVTGEAVTLILATIDRDQVLLDQLERNEAEPAGDDRDLIAELDRMACEGRQSASGRADRATTAAGRGRNRRARTRIPQYAGTALSGDCADAPTAPPIQSAPPPRAEQVEPDKAPSRDDERADSKIANQSIRVHVDALEHLMTMVSELVLTRNQLLDIGRRNEDSEFKAPLQRLSNVTAELQEGVMKTRMQPIGNAWQKLPRIVRDLSAELGKPIEFEMQGAETELDRQVLDLIKDPVDPHGPQFRRPRAGNACRAESPPASPSAAPSAWRPGMKAVTSSSKYPTTDAGSTRNASRRPRSPAGSRPRPRSTRCRTRRSRSSSSCRASPRPAR